MAIVFKQVVEHKVTKRKFLIFKKIKAKNIKTKMNFNSKSWKYFFNRLSRTIYVIPPKLRSKIYKFFIP